MYNDELKQRFIKKKESTAILDFSFLERTLKKCEEFELRLGKDLSSFSYYEIADMYKSLNFSSLNSLVIVNNIYYQYCDFCLHLNLVPDSQNHFAEMDRETLNGFINKTVLKKAKISRDTILFWASQLPNPFDSFALLCIFEGIDGENHQEIIQMKVSDIDRANKQIRLCTGRTVNVSDELIDYAIEADGCLVYRAIHKNALRDFPLTPGERIYKDNYNVVYDDDEYKSGRRLYNRLKKIFEYLGVEFLTIKMLIRSGKLYYIDSRLKELNISIEDYVANYSQELANQYGITRVIKAHVINEYREYSS